MNNIFMPKPYKILEIVHETNLEYTFRVEVDVKAEHGQFFQISIPKIGEAPISISAMGDNWMEFTIRKVGKVTNEIFNLSPGDKIFMRGPYGNSFPVNKYKGKDLVVIAGGTGVSPVRSLLKYFYDNSEEIKSLHFIAGFKDENSVLFKEDLNNFKTKFNTIYTLDKKKVDGFEVGLVTEHISKIPFDSFDDYNVIVVGPPVMMHFTALELLKNGVPEDKIWVSFERKMSCGIGKCGHCKINETYVCLEGPVFNYTKAKDLLD
ncbi:anaerobic sulfite reductase subunit AsrB [Thermoanaerobacterium sp. R66]|jgi:anaerobic sulfite reductase subunit B|uniref:anaerobic sulfite reductase subunit AsrB n=1 Tax=Thermoanaerobacterium sp. R66 TaxID=2742479 RepID=UPI00176C5AF7|nr:anaerobic sulfite reductase subunit AsrB [Thermoanaerobacterium sp. R66]MDE4541360.1 anaerobic sulfite reductase subunit AsrB [Thermoanaerobacterium sp. R66]HHV74166.1 anaerobic sulfite reductase subunit AsrB [Thermoanaerobacterium sp.]